MSEEPRTSIRFLYDNLRINQPSQDYSQRRSFNLSFHLPFEINYRADIYLMVAPDTFEKSRSVDIRQHYYGAFIGASVVYTYLFRYSLSLAPGIFRKITESKILSESASFATDALSLFSRVAIDYAPSEIIEVSTTASIFYQIPGKSFEWSYGFGINVNL